MIERQRIRLDCLARATSIRRPFSCAIGQDYEHTNTIHMNGFDYIILYPKATGWRIRSASVTTAYADPHDRFTQHNFATAPGTRRPYRSRLACSSAIAGLADQLRPIQFGARRQLTTSRSSPFTRSEHLKSLIAVSQGNRMVRLDHGYLCACPSRSRPCAFGGWRGRRRRRLPCYQARADNALAIVRPPGHHATSRTGQMGFCLLNNIAIGARHALSKHGIEKVLISSITMCIMATARKDVFYADPARSCSSRSTRYPFYPGSGAMGRE